MAVTQHQSIPEAEIKPIISGFQPQFQAIILTCTSGTVAKWPLPLCVFLTPLDISRQP